MINTHPHYLYSDIVNSIKADKATIVAMSGLLDGTIAYATDANEFGTYSLDTNTWTWVGASALLYVQDEGIPIGTPTTLNFVGNNMDVSISGTVARVFVTGSSDSIVGSSFDNFWNSGTQGNYAIRAKNDSTVNALGNYAFAIGQNSIASGAYSYAQGFQTKATNVGASAEGNLTVASGVNAHAEGNGAVASGSDSHAEGSGLAIGDTSHAEGLGSKAYGAASHAEGTTTVASGTYSFAGGNANHAIGIASAALGGRNNRVSGNNSVVLGGSGTVATYDDTVFVPKLNIRNIQTGTPLLNLGADVNGNVVIGTTGSSSGGGTFPHPPEGRLTLVTGTPVMTTSVATGTSVYYTPYVGDLYPSYNGIFWTERTFVELSLVLDSNSGHTGYHQTGKNFDLFLYNDGGVDRLLSGPAWASDTVQSALLSRKNGILVNNSSMTGRYGNGVSDTLTVPALQGIYVGTIRMWSNGASTWQLGGVASTGSPINLYLRNAYNKVLVSVIASDNTNSWTYASNPVAWRSANNSNNMRASFVSGLSDDAFVAEYSEAASGTNGAAWGVGYDATNAFSGTTGYGAQSTAVFAAAKYETPAKGFHFFQAIEINQTAGASVTYYGDAGASYFQSGLHFSGLF